jgi:hypothetical protein
MVDIDMDNDTESGAKKSLRDMLDIDNGAFHNPSTCHVFNYTHILQSLQMK